MAPQAARKCLSDLYTDVYISRSRESSPTRSPNSLNLYQSLSKASTHKGFPTWSTWKWTEHDKIHLRNFTFSMSPKYSLYAPEIQQTSTKELFHESAAIIEELRDLLANLEDDSDILQEYKEFSAESMAQMIFGSNMIEKAGLDHEVTLRLCMQVFRGEDVNPAALPPRGDEYAANLKFLRKQLGIKDVDEDQQIRSRREIVQHAQALKYIVDASLNGDKPLTEEIILETHRILTNGILDHDYAVGKYRKCAAMAGGTQFANGTEIPWRMKAFVEAFNQDIQDWEKNGQLDPWYLAADVAQDFVCIHPFEDGNGRMCRLLANAYLVKYAGFSASIGEHDGERRTYLEIATRAIGDTEEIARGELARLFLEKGHDTLKRWKSRLQKIKEKKLLEA